MPILVSSPAKANELVPSGPADELAHGRKPQIKPLIMSGDDLQPELQHVPQGLVELRGDERGWIPLHSIP